MRPKLHCHVGHTTTSHPTLGTLNRLSVTRDIDCEIALHTLKAVYQDVPPHHRKRPLTGSQIPPGKMCKAISHPTHKTEHQHHAFFAWCPSNPSNMELPDPLRDV